MSFIKYIADESHYKEVLSLVSKAKQTAWIGTADKGGACDVDNIAGGYQDLYVDDKPFLALIAIEQFDNVWIGKFFDKRSGKPITAGNVEGESIVQIR